MSGDTPMHMTHDEQKFLEWTTRQGLAWPGTASPLCAAFIAGAEGGRKEARPDLGDLRDKFAGQAMQGELACQREGYEWGISEKLAKHCYALADIMLIQREKKDA